MIFEQGYTVYRLRRRLVAHDYGGEPQLADWDDPNGVDFTPFHDCFIGPNATSEDLTINRAQAEETLSLYAPYGVDIGPDDRIVDGQGQIYEVTGYAQHYASPFTDWPAGSVVPLKRIEG